MNKSKSGFTIVELLIVIVVIGILAAITIVAYRGMQQRATTAAITSAADNWEKLIRMELIETGTLPSTASLPGGVVCLGNSGSNFPLIAGKLDPDECMDGGTWSYMYNSTYFSTWKTKAALSNGQLPLTRLTVDGVAPADARGIIMQVQANATSAIIMWVPQVTGQCGRGTDAYLTLKGSGALTGGVCQLVIPFS